MTEPDTDNTALTNATCRVALAAFLHDLGKFAERARLDFDPEARGSHITAYCPFHEDGGWHSHKHAAYTALAWDLIEQYFPELVGEDVTPFTAWNAADVDDSVVNAASRHHKPETFLQWIIATADRVASGFEREEFAQYNRAEDKSPQQRNHYTSRLLTIFEQIHLEESGSMPRPGDLKFRYPLEPLSVNGLFPVPAEECEQADNTAAQAEYRELWRAFTEALAGIPSSHRNNWSLWLDHFDSAWACYTQAIPAATAFNVRPEVSLYDHSCATAALATALWRYHHDRGEDTATVRQRLADWERPDWDEEKFLLVQGDFFGIQEFLFASGGETQRRAARLLRGRSFYISLLTECAALRVLDALALPATSQVTNAAGKFLIVAPNTPEARARLEEVQQDLDGWFLRHSFGQAGIGLAWLPACCNDFLSGKGQGGETRFGRLMDRLFEALEDAKTRRFDLCGPDAPTPVFARFLDNFDNELGVCRVDGQTPAIDRLDGSHDGPPVSALAFDQIEIGKRLAHDSRVLITREPLSDDTLRIPLFGYHIQFTGHEEAIGRFGPEAGRGNLLRAWDYTIPEGKTQPLFEGYAKRFINGYVPIFGTPNEWELGRYHDVDEPAYERDPNEPKTLEVIACDDRIPASDSNTDYRGVAALTTLKGDVDDLGKVFESGLQNPTFAKMSGLSRQMNAFFSVWLPWYCAAHEGYRSTYTVFAGGDDFFLIGPWRSTPLLARDMRRTFSAFVANNPEIHFSAGLAMTKPGMPIRHMGELAEQALDAAKDYREDSATAKNAVTWFGHTVSWAHFEQLLELAEALEGKSSELQLSTGYLYGLQYLADMAEDLRRPPWELESALWNARFTYRTARMLERQRGLDQAARQRLQAELGELIGGAIERHGAAFKVALFTHLYRHRN